MRRTATIMAGLLLGASLLGACGDDGDKGTKDSKDSKDSAQGADSGGGEYCDTLKSSAEEIKEFTADGSAPDFDKFDTFLEKANDIADAAPSGIDKDWETLLGAVDKLTDALKEAGITLEELATAGSTGKLPEGVDQEKLAELGTELQSLTGEEFQQASDRISTHAKEECGVDLEQLR